MGRSKGMSMAVAKHLGKKSSRKGGKRIPKKGSKAVRYGRRYSAAPPKKATSMRKTPYVRLKKRTGASVSKRRCEAWCTSLPGILSAGDRGIVDLLLEEDMIRDWGGVRCPFCSSGTLGQLMELKGGRTCSFGWRCPETGRRKRIFPTTLHPIFKTGHGSASLQKQAAALFCAIADVPQRKAYTLLGMDHKSVDDIYTSWRNTAATEAEKEQDKIVLGDGKSWRDAEVDEVSTKKKLVWRPPTNPGQKATAAVARMEWDSWLGMQERGKPESLVLIQLPKRLTKPAAPGPGPITKEMWTPIAKKLLENRKIILHTDGARAYRVRVQGMRRDSVIHKKKKVNGVWKKPKFAKPNTHVLPDGTKIRCMMGTQTIDGLWKHLRQQIKDISTSGPYVSRIRHFQWRWWRKGKDLWKEAGQTVSRTW